jgi:hypothetical protein
MSPSTSPISSASSAGGDLFSNTVTLPFPCHAFDNRRAGCASYWLRTIFAPDTATKQFFSHVFPVRQGTEPANFIVVPPKKGRAMAVAVKRSGRGAAD